VNWKSKNGLTALALAAKAREMDVVKLLLERDDVDVYTRDNQGKTNMDLAVQDGHKDIVKLLEHDQRTRRRIIHSTPNLPSPQSEPPWVPPTDNHS
jgi:ankyrin repeat protein